MKRYINVLVMIFSFCSMKAQEFKIELSHKYIYSKEWDKLIQTYNFSRPYNTVNQPLLINGLNGSVSRIFKTKSKLSQGFNFSYSYFRSSAENQKFTNNLNLHFLNIGYILHYQNKEKNNRFYSDLIIAVTTGKLSRHLNGKPFEYDNNRSKAFSIGGEADIKFGYNLQKSNKKFLSPFVIIGYCPYLYSPNAETVINQTQGLVGKKWTTILNSQLGLAYHFRP